MATPKSTLESADSTADVGRPEPLDREFLTFSWRRADRSLVEEMLPLDLLLDPGCDAVPVRRSTCGNRQFLSAIASRSGGAVKLSYQATSDQREIASVCFELGDMPNGFFINGTVTFTSGRARRLSICPCPF